MYKVNEVIAGCIDKKMSELGSKVDYRGIT